MIKFMTELNFDLNDTVNHGRTLLMVALNIGHFELAEYLIEKCENLDVMDFDETNALMFIAHKGKSCQHLVEKMVKKKANLDLQNRNGETALMIALKSDNNQMAEYLIEQGANLDLKDRNEQSVLHWACLNEKIKLVHLLIRKGADLNIKNKDGKTPLMLSLQQQFFLISEMLIENNADLSVLDVNGTSVWFYLCDFIFSTEFDKSQRIWSREEYTFHANPFQNKETKWYFENYKQDDEYDKQEANREKRIKGYYIECHKKCLEKVAEKSDWYDKTNNKGETPLLQAIHCKADQWIIELLIKKGANISHVSKEGNKALGYAIENNLVDIAELLIKSGANLNLDPCFAPYLFEAYPPRTDTKLYTLLIQNGANLHCTYRYHFERELVFDLLCKHSVIDQPEKMKIYRNALINELTATFRYSDYDAFKQRVIESIENEEIILIESDHLNALNLLANHEKESDEVVGYLRTSEFRERLIEDYLNVLNGQRELLENRELRLTECLSESSKYSSQNNNKKPKLETAYFKLNELISEESFEHLLDSIQLKDTNIENKTEFTKINQSIDFYLENVDRKIKLGRELLEYVEKVLLN
jgi:ankyrin repeat protein